MRPEYANEECVVCVCLCAERSIPSGGLLFRVRTENHLIKQVLIAEVAAAGKQDRSRWKERRADGVSLRYSK